MSDIVAGLPRFPRVDRDKVRLVSAAAGWLYGLDVTQYLVFDCMQRCPMQLSEIARIQFSDLASGSEAAAVIRATTGQLALCVSLADDGDVEVVFGQDDLDALLVALQRAALVARDKA